MSDTRYPARMHEAPRAFNRGVQNHIRGVHMLKLMQGDCLELMQDIPDKSVDLILTDPPYNIGKAKWDKIPNYIEWCGKWFIECQRVLKDNGSFYWWQNDMVQIAQLMEWIRQNTQFVFKQMGTFINQQIRRLRYEPQNTCCHS